MCHHTQLFAQAGLELPVSQSLTPDRCESFRLGHYVYFRTKNNKYTHTHTHTHPFLSPLPSTDRWLLSSSITPQASCHLYLGVLGQLKLCLLDLTSDLPPQTAPHAFLVLALTDISVHAKSETTSFPNQTHHPSLALVLSKSLPRAAALPSSVFLTQFPGPPASPQSTLHEEPF
jgi:hypothetical protein